MRQRKGSMVYFPMFQNNFSTDGYQPSSPFPRSNMGPPPTLLPVPRMLLQHQEIRNDGEPRIDAMCSPREYKFAVDLPGVSADTLRVTLENRTICISGSRPALVLQPPTLVYVSERPIPSRFRRNILLHTDVDLSAGIEAHFRDGLLCLSVKRNHATLPNSEVVNISSRQIPVRHVAATPTPVSVNRNSQSEAR